MKSVSSSRGLRLLTPCCRSLLLRTSSYSNSHRSSHSDTDKLPAAAAVKISDSVSLKQLVDRTDLFIFDCDGVLWRGMEAIPGSRQVIEHLRSMGKKVAFVTNSTQSRLELTDKFRYFGLSVEVEGTELC
jgi:hypothetical protein